MDGEIPIPFQEAGASRVEHLRQRRRRRHQRVTDRGHLPADVGIALGELPFDVLRQPLHRLFVKRRNDHEAELDVVYDIFGTGRVAVGRARCHGHVRSVGLAGGFSTRLETDGFTAPRLAGYCSRVSITS